MKFILKNPFDIPIDALISYSNTEKDYQNYPISKVHVLAGNYVEWVLGVDYWEDPTGYFYGKLESEIDNLKAMRQYISSTAPDPETKKRGFAIFDLWATNVLIDRISELAASQPPEAPNHDED